MFAGPPIPLIASSQRVWVETHPNQSCRTARIVAWDSMASRCGPGACRVSSVRPCRVSSVTSGPRILPISPYYIYIYICDYVLYIRVNYSNIQYLFYTRLQVNLNRIYIYIYIIIHSSQAGRPHQRKLLTSVTDLQCQ